MQNTAIVTNAQNGNNGGIQINTSGGLAPYTYAWSNGGSGNQIDGLSQGEYSCIVTDANGCSEELTIQIIDLQMEEKISSARMYPQPFHDHLNIELNGEHAFTITDVAGKNVLTGSFVDLLQLDTSPWSCGIYFIQFDHVFAERLCKY
jgi:hypothetical protein